MLAIDVAGIAGARRGSYRTGTVFQVPITNIFARYETPLHQRQPITRPDQLKI